MMRRAATRWLEAARSVGRALLDVLAAEAAELKADLGRSGRELRLGVILVVLAAGVGFWTIALGLWVAVELLRLKLSLLAATVVIFCLALVVTLALLWLAKWRLGRVETPLHAFKRRGREHADWWRNSVVPGLVGEVAGDAAEGASEGDPDGRDG
jgi:hypothetical protein